MICKEVNQLFVYDCNCHCSFANVTSQDNTLSTIGMEQQNKNQNEINIIAILQNNVQILKNYISTGNHFQFEYVIMRIHFHC